MHTPRLAGPVASPLPRRARSLAAPLLAAALAALSASACPADAWAKGDKKPAAKADKKPSKAKADAKEAKADKKPSKSKSAAAGSASASASSASAAPADRDRDPPAAASPPIEVKLPVERFALENGLRVVLNPDHTSPTVAVAVTYDVGSRNEEKGRSGFAHLFEHMMFQGSKNVPKGDHFRLVSSHGGVLNGTTNNDRTNYFEVLPANELALGLWLEADRMKSLDVSEANFENQRKVVQEEYRMRVSNVAYAPSAIRLEELVFQGYWPYEHSVIGSMADLDGAKLEWVQAFHDTHYGPNNAVVTLAGDFEPADAKALVEKYFGPIAKVHVDPYQEAQFPEQTSQRTAVVRDDNARTPGVAYGWSIPPARSADHYALEMAALLLGDGQSSRLHQLLVRDKAVAQRVSVGTDDRRGPDIFTVNATLSDGARMGDVEKLVEGELKALAKSGPSDAELSKVRRQVQSGFVLGLQANLSRARRLGEYETYFGDASLLNGELPRYLAVTKDDVKRVAAQYLGATRRTIVETYPTEAPKEAGKDAGKGDDKPSEHAKGKKAGGKSGSASDAKTAKGGSGKDAKPKKKKK